MEIQPNILFSCILRDNTGSPPVLFQQAKPDSLDAVITQSVARALDLFDITLPETHRWTES